MRFVDDVDGLARGPVALAQAFGAEPEMPGFYAAPPNCHHTFPSYLKSASDLHPTPFLLSHLSTNINIEHLWNEFFYADAFTYSPSNKIISREDLVILDDQNFENILNFQYLDCAALCSALLGFKAVAGDFLWL